MFKKHWLRRNRILSDEGYSVEIIGRDTLVYQEGTRRMPITVEMGLHGFAVLVDTVGRWEDSPDTLVEPQTQTQIVNRIKRALESQAEQVTLL